MKLGTSIDFILYKVYADIRTEAARSYLGLLWWVIEPVLYLCAFYILFVLILRQSGPDFVPSFLCGTVVWKWFDSGIKGGGHSISANRELLAQVYVPKYVFPTISVVGSTLRFFPVFIILIVFLAVYGISPSLSWVAIPILLLTQLFVILAGAMLLGAFIPFLPDLRVAIDNGMLLLFFVSGIFFNLNEVNEPLRTYLNLNPMATLINDYRIVMIHGGWPNIAHLFLIILCSLLVGVLALFLLRKLDGKYGKVRI